MTIQYRSNGCFAAKRHTALRALTILVLSTAHSFIASAQEKSVADARSRLQEATTRGFSGYVLAVRDGKTVLQQSLGSPYPGDTVSFDSTTVMAIASITKQFTRAAVLKLEQQHKLSTADSVGKYVPALPADKRVITLAQLIDMRSGLHEYHERDGDTVPADLQRMSRAEALQRIAAQPLLFPPGERRQYSNSGYTLLAAVVEAASGHPFEQYVRDELIQPAGLTSTGFWGEERWKHVRISHARSARFGAPELWPEGSWVVMGSGGMMSTARDLAAWIRALRSGRILSPEELSKHYPQGDWAMYAGGQSIGFETDIIELRGGRDFVILHSNAGLGWLPLAGDVAAAISDQPLPEGLRSALAGMPRR
ncbi:MAG TPA: serine hydrolase domain-containing protein [Gemmatimonadaceae bacterium]|nr:serine hydrolase domain-containing protein [Gemmatimonadaceae bacterium]